MKLTIKLLVLFFGVLRKKIIKLARTVKPSPVVTEVS